MTAEIDCKEARMLVHASIDGELDAANAARFDAHLDGCADCAADRARLLALRAAIRAEVPRHAMPPELRAKLLETIGAPADDRGSAVVPFARPRAGRWSFAGAGFAAGALLAASLAVYVGRANVDSAESDAFVAAHIRALQPGHLTDVQVSDRHQVKPWFDGKIDLAPPVKELSDQGFDLVGGRLDYAAGRDVAVVVYRHGLHLIDLFVTKSADTRPPGPVAASPAGYEVAHWSDGGLGYWAVSDLGPDELADFVRLWRQR